MNNKFLSQRGKKYARILYWNIFGEKARAEKENCLVDETRMRVKKAGRIATAINNVVEALAVRRLSH